MPVLPSTLRIKAEVVAVQVPTLTFHPAEEDSTTTSVEKGMSSLLLFILFIVLTDVYVLAPIFGLF